MKKVHNKTDKKVKNRVRRHLRVRKAISGTAKRPRLAIFRSNMHIYAQLIDDEANKTLAMASTLTEDVKSGLKGTSNKDAAEAVGKKIAELAKEKKIKTVVFDKGGFLYHGRVKALAEAARKGGLKF
ncbi:MAG TPA: 50S ribosomal protein L18 [Candidatus Mcinerneyibacteriales bacterium]|jgi:large subunit ribosomal protein L18|nr:50S ribosomal protein L18 [Candidatus Mcinerneyibacteriales bacterium]HPQ89123.1 50S ribosomal protein L18 [Candidatus Mcinerneyibacteriales bacterium]